MLAETTLIQVLNDTDTTAAVAQAKDFPTAGSVIIGEEIISYTGKTDQSLTGLVRAELGTTAEGNPIGTKVVTFGALSQLVQDTKELAVQLVTKTEFLAVAEPHGKQITKLVTAVDKLKSMVTSSAASVATLNQRFTTLGHEPVFHVVPIGAVDGNNKDYQLPDAQAYVPGSLQVAKNRFLMLFNVDFQETDTSTGKFRMTAAPQPGESLVVPQYLKDNVL